MIKVLPKELSEKMNDCIHIVIFVKARALNSEFFVATRRNGIKTSITAYLRVGALAFTEQKSSKTLRAPT